MQTSKELKKRMVIHIKHMIEQHSGHEFDHITGRCRCGASVSLWRCVSAIREGHLEDSMRGWSVIADPMRPCKYSEV